MGIFDRARDPRDQHADKVGPLVERVADEVDHRTGGEHGAPGRVTDRTEDGSGARTRPDPAPGSDRTA